jgi:hypothetical protein
MLSSIAEFASPDFRDPGQRVFLFSSLSVMVLLILGRERPRPIEWLLPLFFFAQSLLSVRNEALFGILAAPLAAQRLELLLREASSGHSALAGLSRSVLASSQRLLASDCRAGGGLSLALLVVGVLGVLHLRGPDALDFDPQRHPVHALAYVESHPERFSGRMFNSYAWGGFIAYRGFPERRTFINGFGDHYGPELLETYLDVVRLEQGWREILDRYGIEWVVYGTDTPLIRRLREDPEWRLAYSDELATVLERRVREQSGSATAEPPSDAAAFRGPPSRPFL